MIKDDAMLHAKAWHNKGEKTGAGAYDAGTRRGVRPVDWVGGHAYFENSAERQRWKGGKRSADDKEFLGNKARACKSYFYAAQNMGQDVLAVLKHRYAYLRRVS